MNAAIRIDGMSVVMDGKQILSDVTAAIPQGKITGLLGPSGAGKTTLIRTLLGLQKPTKGSLSILGLPPAAKALRSQIGYVTQSPAVYGDLTVAENLAYFGRLVGVDAAAVEAVLKTVALEPYAGQLVARLSGGQQARVSLAAALLGEPKVLLLDEPTVGLDPVLRQTLWQTFRELADQGTTLLVSSHVMDEADKCDAIMFIRDGQLLASDTKEAIMRQTNTHAMEAAFLELAAQGGAP